MADMGAVLPGIDKLSNFYVYALLKEDGSPFYIGKGKGRRWRDSKRKRDATDVKKVAELLGESEAFELECFLIDEIGRAPNGPLVNRCAGGYGASGWKKSPELIAKMAKFHRGRKRSPETRKAISAALVGREINPEIGKKISAALIGRKAPPEAAERMRAYATGRPISSKLRTIIVERNKQGRGRKWSPEFRAKMMPIHADLGRHRIGSKLPLEAREKISAARRGSKASAETRAKMAASQRGRKHSQETRAKISATHIAGHKVDDKQWPLEL